MATASPQGPQIFICYDKTYQERALELHARLANDLQGKLSRDVVVFIDRENLGSGDAWDAKIREALASTRLLIVLLNDGLVLRPYCRFEISTVLARKAAGEKCYVLPVRWQRDSEIYRSGTVGTASVEAVDQAYLDSLPAEAADLVRALRAIQFLDGAALREDGIGSDSFNAAFRELSAEATRLYRLALREQAAPAAPPSSATATPVAATAGGLPAADKPRRGLGFILAGIAALAVAVGVFLALGPFGDAPPVAPPEPPQAEVEPPPPQWTTAGETVENRSGGDIVARREPRQDAPELETLAPGAIRPALGVKGAVLAAEVDGVRWLSYPTPVSDVRGYVRQSDVDTAAPPPGD